MKILVYIIFLIGVYSKVNSQDTLLKYIEKYDALKGRYIRGDSLPHSCESIEETIIYLDSIFHPVIKNYIKTISENEFIKSYSWCIEIRENIYFRDIYDSLNNLSYDQVRAIILKIYYLHNKGINFDINKIISQYISDYEKLSDLTNELPLISKKINKHLIDTTKAFAVRTFYNINDTTHKIVLTINSITGGPAGLYEQIPCKCKVKMLRNASGADYIDKSGAFFIGWLLIYKGKYNISYNITCKLDQNDFNLFSGMFIYLFDNERKTIDILNLRE